MQLAGARLSGSSGGASGRPLIWVDSSEIPVSSSVRDESAVGVTQCWKVEPAEPIVDLGEFRFGRLCGLDAIRENPRESYASVVWMGNAFNQTVIFEPRDGVRHAGCVDL